MNIYKVGKFKDWKDKLQGTTSSMTVKHYLFKETIKVNDH
ncbi:hypothetical protein SAMN05444360_104218 [Chryseobacterium carnipullorum]|nr:hypothetical protein SAMN05444360_104218 [Chryseobacterium carnipullorum]